MPLYPYRCTKCGHRFEKIQSFTDAPETVCPKCGGPLERPLTAPGLQFKGAGWYVNDYSRSGSSSSESSESKPAESKPAAETKSSGESKASSTDASGTSSAPAKSDSSKS